MVTGELPAALTPGSGTNVLRGVLATSAASAWTVGDYYNGTVDKTLILHWNGKHWLRSSQSERRDRQQRSERDRGHVVQEHIRRGRCHQRRQLEGAHPALERIPLASRGRDGIPGTAGNELNALFALSPTSIWAVGSYNDGGFNRTLIEHCR